MDLLRWRKQQREPKKPWIFFLTDRFAHLAYRQTRGFAVSFCGRCEEMLPQTYKTIPLGRNSCPRCAKVIQLRQERKQREIEAIRQAKKHPYQE